MASLARKILSNTFWQVLGRVGIATIGIISIKIVTNYLPTDVYGQYTTLYEFIGFFAIAADFGLYTIGVREMAKKEKPPEKVLANILAIRIGLIIMALGLSVLVATNIPQYAGSFVAKGMWLVAITTALMLIHGTLTSVLQYKLKMQFATISLILGKIITVGYIVATVLYLKPDNLNEGFIHLLYAGIFGNIIMVALTAFFVSKHTKIYVDFNWDYSKELVMKALPYGLALILSTVYFKIDVVLLSLLRNYHETGIYGVALKFMEILTVIPVFFMNSALPAITESFRENRERFRQLLSKSWQFMMLLATPLAIGGILLAFPITFIVSSPQFLSGYHCADNIQVVYQEQREAVIRCTSVDHNPDFSWETESNIVYLSGSDTAMRLILIAMFFAFLSTLFGFTLVAIDQQIKLLWINGGGAIFNLITNIIFIPEHGFKAAAITTIITQFLIFITSAYTLTRTTSFEISIPHTLKILLSGAIMGVVIYFLQPVTYGWLENINVLLLVPIGALVYLAALLGLKAVDHDQIRKIIGRA